MSSALTFDNLLYWTPGLRDKFEFDFEDEIPAGDSIKAPGALTKVSAVDENGINITNLITEVTVDGTKLRATIANVLNDKDYFITYTIRTEISSQDFDKFLVVRGRTRGLVL